MIIKVVNGICEVYVFRINNTCMSSESTIPEEQTEVIYMLSLREGTVSANLDYHALLSQADLYTVHETVMDVIIKKLESFQYQISWS